MRDMMVVMVVMGVLHRRRRDEKRQNGAQTFFGTRIDPVPAWAGVRRAE